MSIQELIRKGDFDQIRDMMEQSLTHGSQTFERSLLDLFSSGLITREEALANSDSPTNLAWLINNAKPRPTTTGPDITQPIQAPSTRTEGADLGSFKFNMDVV